MKKIVCILTLIMISTMGVLAFANQGRQQKLYFETKEIVLSDSYVSQEGVTYVPLRELFEKLGKNVTYKSDDQSIYIHDEETVVSPEFIQHHTQKFNEYLSVSHEEILDNGVKIKYTAPKDFSDSSYEVKYDKYFDDRNMAGGNSYSQNLVGDAKTVVELARFYWKESDKTDVEYEVLYDFENDAWIVCDSAAGSVDVNASGPKGIVIKSYDGQVIATYGAGFNNTTYVKEVYGQ